MIEPFDLLGPLPTGTTVLEASAGTGKTYALAGLVTRYVAEGAARLDEMLLITFGRAASQELREHVRAQLLDAEQALADPGAWCADPGLLGHLVRTDDAELARRRVIVPLRTIEPATLPMRGTRKTSRTSAVPSWTSSYSGLSMPLRAASISSIAW